MDYDDDQLAAFSSSSTQALESCGTCGRNFNPDALRRHAPICAKGTTKKRKVYDMTKHRAEGTDNAEFARNQRFAGRSGQRKQEPTPKKNNWRQKHEDFINAIRSAKGVQKAIDSGGPLPPPPPPSINPDYVQCQYCSRRFNQQAAQRHIDFCKTQHDRLPNKKQPSAAAQQRAAARTQYKVPRPKGKFAVTSPTSPGYSPEQYSFSGGSSGGSSGGGGGGSGSGNRTGSSRSSGASSGRPNNRYSGGSGNHGNSMSVTGSSPDYGGGGGGRGGRALRTGRNAETYSEARQLSAKQRSNAGTPKRYPGSAGSSHSNGSLDTLSSIATLNPAYASHYNHHQSSPHYSTSTHTGPTPGSGRGPRTPTGGDPSSGGDSYGVHSSKAASTPTRGSSGAARFCHECGSKYPVITAKFCCECGIRRMNVA